jgi:rRNA maturation protein Nop10
MPARLFSDPERPEWVHEEDGSPLCTEDYTLACPECGGEAEPGRPENWIVPGDVPEYRHADDKTGLCPVVGPDGYRPTLPVEHLRTGA